MDISKKIAEELGVKQWQTDAAIELIDEGCTIPFIARYRKEKTGTLNDEQLRKLGERLTYLRNLEDRKTAVISSIEEQGKLTDELKAKILEAETMVAVEDLYRPYKQKKKTRASVAKEKGLEGLATIIRLEMTKNTIEEEAKKFINPEKEVNTVTEAINGALDIIAESISDDAEIRADIRKRTFDKGIIKSEGKDKEAEGECECG